MPGKKPNFRFSYFLISSFFKLFHRIKVEGQQNIVDEKPLIVAANHTSYYDPVIIHTVVYPRKINYMAKAELFRIPVLSFILRFYNTFPVKRDTFDRKAIKTAIERLRRNELIGVFPEGTRVKEGDDSGKIFQGAAYLAYKTGAAVLPVGITGTDKIMPEGKKIPRLAKILVKVGKPIKFETAKKSDLTAFSAKIIDEINKLKSTDVTS